VTTDAETTPKRRSFAAWDLIITISLLVCSLVGVVVTAVLDLALALSGADYCCGRAATGSALLLTVWVATAVVVLIATIVSVVLLVTRRRSWWVATLGVVILIGGTITGFWLYAGIVSGAHFVR
jgi:hypothetical protein